MHPLFPALNVIRFAYMPRVLLPSLSSSCFNHRCGFQVSASGPQTEGSMLYPATEMYSFVPLGMGKSLTTYTFVLERYCSVNHSRSGIRTLPDLSLIGSDSGRTSSTAASRNMFWMTGSKRSVSYRDVRHHQHSLSIPPSRCRRLTLIIAFNNGRAWRSGAVNSLPAFFSLASRISALSSDWM
jgi:hypothetical protein